MMNSMPYHSGQWVEILSKEEILQTLDQKGQLEGLPFMPGMFQYCGKRFRVVKRAHKTCDTVNDYKGRKMNRAVHLEGLRCDGEGYEGCQAACLIFWKEAWLKKVVAPSSTVVSAQKEAPNAAARTSGCREEDVWAATKLPKADPAADQIYVCQATILPGATEPLPWWDLRQYVEDLTSGNVGVRTMARGFIYMGYNSLINAGIGLGRPLRILYDTFQRLTGGIPYPRKRGRIPAGVRTPGGELNLQSGDWVRVKSYDAILATLDTDNKNRGLVFDAEMVPFCGRTLRVRQRVHKIVNEKNGKMMEFKNPCIMLHTAVCEARYSECRLFCPRAIYSYWRELWLERVSEAEAVALNKGVQETAG
jgi:hypothetical protein